MIKVTKSDGFALCIACMKVKATKFVCAYPDGEEERPFLFRHSQALSLCDKHYEELKKVLDGESDG